MSFQSEVIDDICEDLASHVERDPAVLGEPLLVLTPNAPFVATLCQHERNALAGSPSPLVHAFLRAASQ